MFQTLPAGLCGEEGLLVPGQARALRNVTCSPGGQQEAAAQTVARAGGEGTLGQGIAGYLARLPLSAEVSSEV